MSDSTDNSVSNNEASKQDRGSPLRPGATEFQPSQTKARTVPRIRTQREQDQRQTSENGNIPSPGQDATTPHTSRTTFAPPPHHGRTFQCTPGPAHRMHHEGFGGPGFPANGSATPAGTPGYPPPRTAFGFSAFIMTPQGWMQNSYFTPPGGDANFEDVTENSKDLVVATPRSPAVPQHNYFDDPGHYPVYPQYPGGVYAVQSPIIYPPGTPVHQPNSPHAHPFANRGFGEGFPGSNYQPGSPGYDMYNPYSPYGPAPPFMLAPQQQALMEPNSPPGPGSPYGGFPYPGNFSMGRPELAPRYFPSEPPRTLQRPVLNNLLGRGNQGVFSNTLRRPPMSQHFNQPGVDGIRQHHPSHNGSARYRRRDQEYDPSKSRLNPSRASSLRSHQDLSIPRTGRDQIQYDEERSGRFHTDGNIHGNTNGHAYPVNRAHSEDLQYQRAQPDSLNDRLANGEQDGSSLGAKFSEEDVIEWCLTKLQQDQFGNFADFAGKPITLTASGRPIMNSRSRRSHRRAMARELMELESGRTSQDNHSTSLPQALQNGASNADQNGNSEQCSRSLDSDAGTKASVKPTKLPEHCLARQQKSSTDEKPSSAKCSENSTFDCVNGEEVE